MWRQVEFSLKPRGNGFHIITQEVMAQLPPLPRTGLLNLFIKHTSAALSINENADPDVRTDLRSIFNRLIKEGEPYYEHTMEGLDDMPAHAKCSIIVLVAHHTHHRRPSESRHLAGDIPVRVP